MRGPVLGRRVRRLLRSQRRPHGSLGRRSSAVQLGPWELSLRKKSVLPTLRGLSPSGGGWWPIIRESFTGAWQRNEEVTGANALSYYAVYSCVRLISTDIGKLYFRLVEQNDEGIWS